MLTRAIGSLRYRWKKVLLYTAAFTVLFSLCFGSIVLFSSVRDQKHFLQGSLERSVTLRASSYRIRVNESQAGVLSFSLDAADVETFLGDPAVVGWNACLGSAARIENTVLPYQEEREISWENHRSGQTGAVGKDGMAALFVEDSRRSLAFLVCGLELVEGTHFAGEKENVCLVSQLFAERNGLEVGDTVVATNPTEGLGQREPFRVEAKITGIFSCPDSERLKGIGARAEEMLFFPMEMYEQMGGKETGGSYKYVTAYLKEGADVDDFAARMQEALPIGEVLESHYTQGVETAPPDEFVGMNYEELAENVLNSRPPYILQLDREWYSMVAQPVEQQVKLAGAMTVLLLVSVTCILALTTMLSMKERWREAGILLSLGETRARILGQLLLEWLTPVGVALLLGIGIGMAMGIPLVEELSNDVYAQQAAEVEKDNQAVTFGSLLATTDSFEINEGKLSMDLTDGGVTDVAAFPLVKTRVDGPAMGAYAAILLLIALLTGTVQGIAVTRAKPAAILLGRG